MRDGQVRFRLQQRHLLASKFQVCLALIEVALGLIDGGLIGPLIQDIQYVTGFHLLARTELPLVDVSIHAPANFHAVAGIGLRRVLGKDGHVGRPHLGHQHERRRLASASILRGRTAAGGCQPRRDGQHRGGPPVVSCHISACRTYLTPMGCARVH